MINFLSELKKNTFRRNGESAIAPENLFFHIDFDANGAYVHTVDKKGNNIDVDYRGYSGDVYTVLKSMADIKQKNDFTIQWEGVVEQIYLGDYPYLMYQLIRCSNICYAQNKELHVMDGQASVQLRLNPTEEGKNMEPSFCIVSEDALYDTFRFLTDSFVLVSDHILNINPLGNGYKQLDVFKTTMRIDMMESYLSILVSYLQNIEIHYDDYEVHYAAEPIQSVPALMFQKVDVDRALFLRMINTLPNVDFELVEQYELSWLAILNEMERKLVFRRILRTPLEGLKSNLNKLIQQQAPTKEAKKELFFEDDLFIIPAETAGPFLLNCLPQMAKDFNLLGADKLKEYKVKVAQPKLNVNFSSGIDFLEGDATLSFDDEQLTLMDVLSQYKKNRYIILSDKTRAVIDEAYMSRLERLFSKTKDKGKKVRISFFDLPEIEDLLQERLEGEAFKKHRSVFEGFNKIAETRFTKPKVNATLRNYQEEGVKWIRYLYDQKLGGCLADDMGLGKTIQTISMLTYIYPKTKKPTLIVMPRSLLFNWQNELQRFAPQLKVYTYYAASRVMSEAMTNQVILTTYAMMRNDVEQFKEQEFHYIILDESQNIKNINAQTTQAILLQKAKHRLALSGTPIENNLTELYSLFRFLNPAMFGSLDDFNMRYGIPIQKDNNKDVIQSLRKKIYPFILRRLKKDVLKELPDRMEQTLYVEMSNEQQRYYEQRRKAYHQQIKEHIASEGMQKSQMVIFQALNELRRIASIPESMTEGKIESPKIDLLLDYLVEATTNGHKVLVFFNFIAGIELLSDKLNDAGIDFVSMTGSTRDRQSLVERFQSDRNCKVFLMTLKTGGVGLNLTAADTVFIFEPWWNKAAEEQAINRTHRIGQTHKVMSYSILVKQTIEEKIRLLQQQKQDLFESLIGADTSSFKSLSEEDIDYVLG